MVRKEDDMSERRRIMLFTNEPKVISLCHFESVVNNNIVDECGNIWTKSGTPTLTGSNYKFGSKCLWMGSSYKLTWNTGLPLQDFTLEAFIRTDNAGGTDYNWRNVIRVTCDSFSGGVVGLSTADFKGYGDQYYSKPASTDILYKLERGSWHHVAFVFKKNTYTLDIYKDGTRIHKDLAVSGTYSSNNPMSLLIGAGVINMTNMDELRFSLGHWYREDSLVVPTSAFSL